MVPVELKICRPQGRESSSLSPGIAGDSLVGESSVSLGDFGGREQNANISRGAVAKALQAAPPWWLLIGAVLVLALTVAAALRPTAAEAHSITKAQCRTYATA